MNANAAVIEQDVGLRWHLVQCQFGSDRHALEWLHNQGFEKYYPVMRTYRQVAKRFLSREQRKSLFPVTKPVMEPLFPRYIFVRFDIGDGRWRKLFDFVGLTGLVCSGGSSLPAPMPDGVVEGLMQREVNGALLGAMPINALPFDLGEEVRITHGPFAGHNGRVDQLPSGKVEDLDESARVALLVSLFGREAMVDLRIADIAKL